MLHWLPEQLDRAWLAGFLEPMSCEKRPGLLAFKRQSVSEGGAVGEWGEGGGGPDREGGPRGATTAPLARD